MKYNLILPVAFLLLLLSACDKEESLTGQEAFLGTWQETTFALSYTTDSLGNVIDTITNKATLILSGDNRYQAQNERFIGISGSGTWEYQANPEQLIFYPGTSFPGVQPDTVYWKILSADKNDFTVEQLKTMGNLGATSAFRNFVRQ